MGRIQEIPAQFNMDTGVVHNGTVYLAAQYSFKQTLNEQLEDIFQKIDQLLTQVNSNKQCILTVDVCLAFIESYPTLCHHYAVWLANCQRRPMLSCIGAQLIKLDGAPHRLAEIKVTAAVE